MNFKTTIAGSLILSTTLLTSCSSGEWVSGEKINYRDDGLAYKINSQTPFTGTIVAYAEKYKGGIISTVEVKDGMRHGKHLEYCLNGEKRHVWEYKNNTLHGEHNYACQDADLPSKLIRVTSSRDDGFRITEYYFNGELNYLHNYNINGEKHGEWLESYSNGQIKEKGNYKDGRKVGKWEYYTKNGALTTINE